jgi:hypothetical protein
MDKGIENTAVIQHSFHLLKLSKTFTNKNYDLFWLCHVVIICVRIENIS